MKNTKTNAHNRAEMLTASIQNTTSTIDMLEGSSLGIMYNKRNCQVVVQTRVSFGTLASVNAVGRWLQDADGSLSVFVYISMYNSGALKLGACLLLPNRSPKKHFETTVAARMKCYR